MLPEDSEGEVLQELSDDIQSDLLRRMDTSQVVEITEGMETDDLADVLQQLPDRLTQEILAAMSIQDRQRVEAVLSYDEETAGGLMNTDIITVRPRLSVDVVLRYLRRHESLPTATDNLIVVNGKGQYVGPAAADQATDVLCQLQRARDYEHRCRRHSRGHGRRRSSHALRTP